MSSTTIRSSEELKQYLISELARRRASNPRYSIRAYAHFLKINNSTLSQILMGKRPIGPILLQQVASKLDIEIGFIPKVKPKSKAPVFKPLDPKVVKDLSHWYAWALLELVSTEGFVNEPGWIAKRLNIHKSEAEKIIEQLQKCGFLVVGEDHWSDAVKDSSFVTSDYLNHHELKSLQKQILNQAIDAMDDADPKAQNHSYVMMGCSAKDMPVLKEKFRRFRREISRFLKQSKNPKDDVYALQVSFFPLTKDLQK